MANVVYPKAAREGMRGGLNLTGVTVKAVAVDLAAYTYAASHEFLSDIPGGARVATSGALTSKTDTVPSDGIFDADDVTFVAITGASVEAIVLFIDTGVAGTSRLLTYVDSAAGLPFTPSGGDEIVRWNAAGIFQL